MALNVWRPEDRETFVRNAMFAWDVLMMFVRLIVFIAALIGVLAIILAVKSPAHAGHDHAAMGIVGQFYATWNRPNLRNADGARYASCCNENDCAVRIMRKDGDQWLVLYEGVWVPIPPAILEHMQADAEVSPDGQNHACIVNWGNPGPTVLCAVLGSGQ